MKIIPNFCAVDDGKKFEDFYERILFMLGNGYNYLYSTGKTKGYWDDSRSTALAGIALDLKEPANSPWIRMIRENLIKNQCKTGESNGSWNEEIWDSAMSIIALKSFELSSRDPIIKNAVEWISHLYQLNNRTNWHDEPWETSWAVIAILTTGIIPPNVKIEEPVKWLIDFQESDCRIIAPHYTAYYLIIFKLLNKFPINEQDYSFFENSKIKAIDYLFSELDKQKNILWTGEAWANGQILWALAENESELFQHPERIEKILQWFESNQSKAGNWSDTEDTASAIIGLVKLLISLSALKDTDSRRNIRAVLQKRLPAPELLIRKPLIEKHPETGGLSIHLNSRVLKNIALIGATGAALATLISFVEFFKKLFE